MLIDFSVTNFRSIKEKQIFSMQPVAKVKELPENICTGHDYDLLKSMIVYGRNGSGKSNLLRAIDTLRYLIAASDKFKIDDEIDVYEPFKLDTVTKSQAVEFEINFYAKNNTRYNYYVAYNEHKILSEKLYYYPGRKRAKLFVRDFEKEMEVGELIDSGYKEIEKGLYSNQLFLSKIGTEKIDSLFYPYTFLTRHLSTHVVHETHYDDMLINVFTKVMKESSSNRITEGINKLLNVADIGIRGMRVQENTEDDFKFPSTIDKEIKRKIFQEYKYQVRTKHNLYENGEIVGETELNINEESTGTKKLLAFGGVIIDALHDGDVLVIDELDKSLHPLLTRALIKLFNNKKKNPKNAQLIFASHDVSLLTNEIFRRDQITFCDKNEEGASNYYSLADIKGVRKELSYEKYYLKGIFGATPSINEYELDFNIAPND